MDSFNRKGNQHSEDIEILWAGRSGSGGVEGGAGMSGECSQRHVKEEKDRDWER